MKYVVDDKNVSTEEVQELLHKMLSNNRKVIHDIFNYDNRNYLKEEIALQNSILITAREGEKLIGLARIVTDGAYDFYLSELMVIPEKRKEGIWKRLTEKFIEYFNKKEGHIGFY